VFFQPPCDQYSICIRSSFDQQSASLHAAFAESIIRVTDKRESPLVEEAGRKGQFQFLVASGKVRPTAEFITPDALDAPCRA
jgi:hypothetical protein